MRESHIERKMKGKVEEAGGWFLKFTSPSQAGVPDRLVLLPKGKAFFAEIKAPGKVPEPLQRKVIERMVRLGHPVEVIDSIEQIDDVIKRYTERGDDRHD